MVRRSPPPPTNQSDHHGKKRNLPLASYRAIFGTPEGGVWGTQLNGKRTRKSMEKTQHHENKRIMTVWDTKGQPPVFSGQASAPNLWDTCHKTGLQCLASL